MPITRQNPLLWLLLLLTWVCLAAPHAGLKTAAGNFYGLESTSGEMTGWEAAPRLGFGGSAEKDASVPLVGANSAAAENVIQGIDASTLNRTHNLAGKTATRDVNDIAQSMRESGYSGPPIDVIEQNGQYYIIDGHHRAAAASMTKTPVDIRVVTDVANHPSSYQTIEEIIRDAQTVQPNRLTPPGKYKR